jgi:metallo-beta-lactamase class B
MSIVRLCVLAVVVFLQVPNPPEWSARIAPFHVIDNIYYVGTEDLAAWLITTPAGHVLVDSGLKQNAAAIVSGIRTLGFKPEDVKFLLTTQAHFNHVAAHAQLKKITGATVVAAAGDAPILEGGGKGDYLWGPEAGFPPVRVDRRIGDGEVIRIGGVELTAHLTPGHTQGTTTWSLPIRDAGKPLQAVIVGSTFVNPGTKLVRNTAYPTIAEDFSRSIDRIAKMKVDVFLAAHLSSIRGLNKMKRLGTRPNPFIDPTGFAAYIANSRKAFDAELAKQRPD